MRQSEYLNAYDQIKDVDTILEWSANEGALRVWVREDIKMFSSLVIHKSELVVVFPFNFMEIFQVNLAKRKCEGVGSRDER